MKLTDDLKNNFIDLMKKLSSDDGVKEKLDALLNNLETKYNKKFKLISYGDRYDKFDEEICILAHPEEDERVVFKASGNNENVFKDNYLERKLFTEIEQNVEKQILPLRSNVKISAVIDKKLEKEVTLLEYIKDEHFLIAMVIVDSQEAFQNMDKVLIDIRDIYPNLKIRI